MERNKKIYLLKRYREIILLFKNYKVEETEEIKDKPKVLVLKKNFYGKELNVA